MCDKAEFNRDAYECDFQIKEIYVFPVRLKDTGALGKLCIYTYHTII